MGLVYLVFTGSVSTDNVLFVDSLPVQLVVPCTAEWFTCKGVKNISRMELHYMVEKTYHIAPYLGAFWAYLILQ